MTTVYIAHAPGDARFAAELAAFLQFGAEAECILATPGPGEDLVELADQGSWAGLVVLVLSPESWPVRIARERWDPLLMSLPLFSILIAECPFPEVLRRRDFFEARNAKARRYLKRRVWQAESGAAETPHRVFSAHLTGLYEALADGAGIAEAGEDLADQFAQEATGDFEELVRVPCRGRTLAQVLGELGAAVGRRHPILVDGEVEANAAELRKILSARRYLVVLDGPEAAHVAALGIDTGQPLGRTSVLMTPGLRAPWETPRTLGYARWLMEGRRFAEAYELLQSLAEAGAEKASIARELAWICEQWDRVDEGRYWRDQCAPLAPAKPAGPGEQMGLF